MNFFNRNLPNAITCCNLLSGCVAAVLAFEGNYRAAFGFIILGAVFDFFDGMTARLLGVSGPMGKELDSLADDITFGFAPSVMVFSFFKDAACPAFLLPLYGYLPYSAFLISAFSALRLAKFNIDKRQTSSFIGLPTPADALFWGSLIIGLGHWFTEGPLNVLWLLALVIIMSLSLVAELPMFSLKFKNLGWADNKVRYIFLAGCLPLFLLGAGAFAPIIAWYVILSIIAPPKA